MDAVLVATCNCGETRKLKEMAELQGYNIIVDVVSKSDDRTDRASRLGVKLPVLIRQDDMMSHNGIDWVG